jgi:leader peptidase (prepilin peptidase)/N-methyltransferase
VRQEELLIWLAVLATAAVAAVVVQPLLRWLPEPVGEDPAAVQDKVSYASLATPSFVLGCTLCTAVAAAVAWTTLPPALQLPWTVLAVLGVLLAAIDLTTTWLPTPLIHIAWVAMAFAALAGASLAGSWTMLARAAIGAALARGLYYLVWRLSRGGFAFGDVRFAPLLGAATGAGGWDLLVWGMCAGTLLGGVQAAVRLLRRRPGAFPYAPVMLGGPYLTALVLALLP